MKIKLTAIKQTTLYLADINFGVSSLCQTKYSSELKDSFLIFL